MTYLAIKTGISEERIKYAGQPNSEFIMAQCLYQNVPGIHHNFVETSRFGDFLRQGGESIRYYHLLGENLRGTTLALAPSGKSRVVSGLYVGRSILFERPTRPFYAYHEGTLLKNPNLNDCQHPVMFVDISLSDNGSIVAMANCTEYFSDHITVSCSTRLPDVLLANYHSLAKFDLLLQEHRTALKPKFTPVELNSVDATIIVDIDSESTNPPRLTIQLTSDRIVHLKPIEVKLYL